MQEPENISKGRSAKVLIVDDHAVVVEGIRKSLKNEPDFEIIGSAHNGLEAIQMVKAMKPDLVVMDISLPELNGVQAVMEIRKWDRNVRFVVFTMYPEKEYIVTLFKIGVSGYVFKDEPISELVMALRAVKEGATFYNKTVHNILREHMEELSRGDAKESKDLRAGITILSDREKEVFVLLADGFTPKAIADRLCISQKTVETHKYNILGKLNVTSVAHLTKLALKKKLIDS